MRTWIHQRYNEKTCGQVAVAVIAGISLEESIKIVGKKGCTRTKDLVKALRKLGYKCPDRCKKMPRPKLGLGQLHDKNRKSGWHWIVVDGDKVFDGINGDADGTAQWVSTCGITSYLPSEKK